MLENYFFYVFYPVFLFSYPLFLSGNRLFLLSVIPWPEHKFIFFNCQWLIIGTLLLNPSLWFFSLNVLFQPHGTTFKVFSCLLVSTVTIFCLSTDLLSWNYVHFYQSEKLSYSLEPSNFLLHCSLNSTCDFRHIEPHLL